MTFAQIEEIFSDPIPSRPHYLVQKNPPNDLAMSQFNPVHTLTPYLRKILFIHIEQF
jgi:hypothetical protein